MAVVALTVLFPLLIHRPATACREYLHVRNPLAVAVASQVIVVLLLVLIFLQDVGWLMSGG